MVMQSSDVADLLREAMRLQQKGELDSAEAQIGKILAARPDHFDALHMLGVLRNVRGHPAEAVDLFRAALAARPTDPFAMANLGAVLRKLGRTEEAARVLERVAALDAIVVEAHNGRGSALLDLNRVEEALSAFDKALAIRPDHAGARNNRGMALARLGRTEEARASFHEAVAIKPDYANAWSNLGLALHGLGRPLEALDAFDKALAINPGYAEAWSNRGLSLHELERFDDALASYDKAIAIRPSYAGARLNRSLTHFLRGDFDAGREDYERHWERHGAPARKLVSTLPVWKGEDIAGKRLIVFEEQGLGDIIQFARFVPMLAARGAHVDFLVSARLHRLLRPLTSSARLVEAPEPSTSHDFQIPLMSLPGVLDTRLETIPATVPYLRSEPELVARWREKLGAEGPRIGICWQGQPRPDVDLGRSIPLACFRPLAAIPGARLISLQKNHGVEQLAALPEGMTVETLGDDFDSGPDAFVDTAAVMANLDLIVTSDTSVAHLAGALGQPVWLVLKRPPDWRWLLERSDSPWYPSMRLYRQAVRGDWDETMGRVAVDAARMFARRTDPLRLPGSPGELLDRISILEIKSRRIADSAKLANVARELAALREAAQALPSVVELTGGLMNDLRVVNERLWDIEDAIRGHEARGDFGASFIELARSVYKNNDIRAAIKKRINELFGSPIIEEKSFPLEADDRRP